MELKERKNESEKENEREREKAKKREKHRERKSIGWITCKGIKENFISLHIYSGIP